MSTKRERGSALLAVLWLMAALSAIAFTVANTVRAETERTSTSVDSVRAYYLASGAVDRALLYIQWGQTFRNPDGTTKYFQSPMPLLQFDFPTGVATVEVIPDSAKLSVNVATIPELTHLRTALGVPGDQAQAIVAGITDWRSPSQGGASTQFDQHYMGLSPSFRGRHASFQEIEELLLIQGVTPELFYGNYTREQDGRLVPHTGLRDCLSVYGSSGPIDANTVTAPVMQAIGMSPDMITALINRRTSSPFRQPQELAPFQQASSRLAIAPSYIATLRATARLKIGNGQLSDMRRTISASVKFLGPEWNPPFHIMRWYDNAAPVQ